MAVKTVKMYHPDPAATAGPTVADVPEEAVHDWEKQGWSTLPFGGKAKAGATRTMYRLDSAGSGSFTSEVPESMVRQLESEGWSVCAF